MRRLPDLPVLCLALATSLAGAQDTPFQPLRRMLPPMPPVRDIAFGDLDGDGDPDAVAAPYSSADALFLGNDGHGRFRLEEDVLASPSGTPFTALALGDVDADGDLDLLAASLDSLDLYLNDGTGSFALMSGSFPLVYGPRWLEVGDVDGDGRLDVLVTSDRPFVFYGDGAGSFTGSPTAFFYGVTQDAVLVDVDGDADLDIMGLAQSYTQIPQLLAPAGVYLMRNDGARGFVLTRAFQSPPSGVFSIAMGDVDRDGDLDAFLGLFRGGERLYENDGAGRFTPVGPGPPPLGVWSPTRLELVDVDGDTDFDLYSVRIGSEPGLGATHALLINDGSGTFTESSGLPHSTEYSAQGATRAGRPVDFDGDGDADLVGASRLHFGDGAGRFASGRAEAPAPLGTTLGLGLCDVDGDGTLDALSLFADRQVLSINDGTGLLVEAPDRLPASSAARLVDAAFGDVDGDGDADLLLTGDGSSLYVNRSLGRFKDVTFERTPADNAPSNRVALGDLDGDGDLDALFAKGGRYSLGHRAPTPNALWRNDGGGSFDAAAGLPLDAEESRALVLGDLDGDGDLDAVIGNERPNRLYRNDQESRVFADASAGLPPVDDVTLDLALGDLDADGDLDLLANDSTANRAYTNDGAGRFAESAAFPPDEETTGSLWARIAVLDADGDGDLDVLSSRIRSQALDILAYENDGTGRLGPGTPLPLGERIFAVGDLDGDDDPDLFSARGVQTNVTRALAWGSLPRIAHPLELELYGPPSGRWWLVGAAGGPAFVRTPVGSLRLGPDRIVVRRRGVLDDHGRTTVRFRVPDDPSLIGTTIHWQAWITGRLANLERTTFSGF